MEIPESIEKRFEKEIEQAVYQLYDWQHGGTSFYCQLYSLFQKADQTNKHKLSLAFPAQSIALDRWNNSGDYGNDLFRQYNIID